MGLMRDGVSTKAVIGTMAILAVIGYAWVYISADSPPESQASVDADYQASARALAAKQAQTPADSPSATTTDDSANTAVSHLTEDQAYFCGSAETGLHPGWNTQSVVYYCNSHLGVPEPAAVPYGRHPPRSKAEVMKDCIALDRSTQPGDSRALAAHHCSEMLSAQ
jgi:hypothetical protein